jgi:murein DD-endopeptidase MepM/ murein hydrolase activator NlpD
VPRQDGSCILFDLLSHAIHQARDGPRNAAFASNGSLENRTLIVRFPRSRWWISLPVLASLAVIWLAVGGLSRPVPPPTDRLPDEDGAGGAQAKLQTPPGPELRNEGTTVGRGGTLAAALDRLGAPRELRHTLLEEIGAHVDARKLSPRTGLLARIDEAGAWRTVAVRPEPQRFLRVEIGGTPGSSQFDSRWIELPVEVEVHSTSGVIEDSVAQALSDSPDGRVLVPAFADIFQWDVDLLVDPRPGDRVRMVYEIERLGPLPPGLPEFEGAPSRSGEALGIGRILAASYTGARARSNAFWIENDEGQGNYYDAQGQPLRKTFLKSPLNYRRISSGFSRARRNPVTRRVVPHHGVDYAARAGTPVVAAADGRVASAGWDGPLGRAVRIRHGSEYVTIYGHLKGFARGIRRGAEVRQNQVIGYVGSSGRATGPHLHYTVVHGGRPIDPMRMKNPPVEPLDPALLPDLRLAVRQWRPLLDLEADPIIELARRGTSKPARRQGPGA